MKSTKLHIFLGILVISFLFSCSVTEKIPRGRFLLTKNVIEEDGKRSFMGYEAESAIYQQSNKLTFPLGIWFYNASNPEIDDAIREWQRQENPTNRSLDSIFQRDSLYHWMKGNRGLLRGFDYGLSKFFVKNEKEPILLDSIKVVDSEKLLKAYYGFNMGYLQAKVRSEIEYDPKIDEKDSPERRVKLREKQLDNKKAKVIYYVEKGPRYYVDSIYYDIPDPKIKELYFNNLKKSVIKKGKFYNENDYTSEKTRIVKLLRNNGYYNLREVNVEALADTATLSNHRMIGIMRIVPKPTKEQSEDHYNRIYTISEVNIHPDYKEGTEISTVTPHLGYSVKRIYDSAYRSRTFTDAILLEPNKKYSLKDEYNSKSNLNNLDNFTLPEIKYTIDPKNDSALIADVYFNRKMKYSTDWGLDAFTSDYLTIGVSPSLSLLSRNVFGGAENLDLSVRLTAGTSNQIADDLGLALEASTTAKISFPRLLVPFMNTEGLVNKESAPLTSLSASATWQQNIGLGRVSFSGIYDYKWKGKSDAVNHKLEVSNIQYIRNTNSDQYFDLYSSDRDIRDAFFDQYFLYDNTLQTDWENGNISYEELALAVALDSGYTSSSFYSESLFSDFISMDERKMRITEDVLINSSSYTFVYDQQLLEKRNPFYFKGKVELAGNTISLLDKWLDFGKDLNSIYDRGIFGVGYAQYFKLDLELRKHFQLNHSDVIATRFLLGWAIPYGNGNTVPFSKTYFAGGSSDIRAWRAYELGPGELYRGAQSYSTDLLKITANVEYRHKLNDTWSLALFLDTGNIWATRSDALEESKFKFNKFYEQMALGTGFGIRFSLGYGIVFRGDMGYRLYDPNEASGERWFKELGFLPNEYNIGVGLPF